MSVPQPPKLPTPPPTLRICDHGDKRKMNLGEMPVTSFLYGMWFMWFILCVYARPPISFSTLVMVAIIIPGLLVMVGWGVWFVVRLVKFKWERRGL